MGAKGEAEPLKIGVIGARGRMGQAIKRLALANHSRELALVLEITREHFADFAPEALAAEVIIDVSLPGPCEGYLKELLVLDASKRLPAFVIGSTGWTPAQLSTIERYGKRAPLILAPNFSPGVNLFLNLLERSAPLFKKWGYDVALLESHHTKKLDAPSGTARALLSKLEAAELKPQLSCVRAGNIVGTHTVSFIGPQDIFELRHEALDRDLFAKGALIAAHWIGARRRSGQLQQGQYSMQDVIFGS